MAYPAPSLAPAAKYGFTVTLEIEPHEWEKGRILRAAYPDQLGRRIRPDLHFAAIMHDIRQEAIARYGPGCDSDAADWAQAVPRASRTATARP
jgi:hypothetical protein